MKERGEYSHMTRACTMQKVSVKTISVDCLDWFPGGRTKTKEVWQKDSHLASVKHGLCALCQAVTHTMWLSKSKDTWATCWRMAERTRELVAFGTNVKVQSIAVMCSSIIEVPPPFSTSKLVNFSVSKWLCFLDLVKTRRRKEFMQIGPAMHLYHQW